MNSSSPRASGAGLMTPIVLIVSQRVRFFLRIASSGNCGRITAPALVLPSGSWLILPVAADFLLDLDARIKHS